MKATLKALFFSLLALSYAHGKPGAVEFCDAYSLLAPHGAYTRSGKRLRYYAQKDPENVLTFSYEVELLASSNPNIARYYRPLKFSEKEWKALSPIRQNAEVRKVVNRAGRHQVILEKLSDAPKFLAPNIIKDSDAEARIELAQNNVTDSLPKIEFQLLWISDNFDVATVHAHAVHKDNKEPMPGMTPFTKLDFDIEQTTTLAEGYRRYRAKGSLPAKNVTHWSTGLIDKKTLAKIKEHAEKGTESKEAKYIYGIPVRAGNTYGNGRRGQEIRNSTKRVDEAFAKLKKVAQNVEDGYRQYDRKDLHEDPAILSEELFNSLPATQRRFFNALEGNLKQKYKGQTHGGARYGLRFAYPHVDWMNHPYIKSLPKQTQEKFRKKLEAATRHYRDATFRLSSEQKTPAGKIADVQVEMAFWAHSSQIADRLKEGRELYFQAVESSPQD